MKGYGTLYPVVAGRRSVRAKQKQAAAVQEGQLPPALCACAGLQGLAWTSTYPRPSSSWCCLARQRPRWQRIWQHSCGSAGVWGRGGPSSFGWVQSRDNRWMKPWHTGLEQSSKAHTPLMLTLGTRHNPSNGIHGERAASWQHSCQGLQRCAVNPTLTGVDAACRAGLEV